MKQSELCGGDPAEGSAQLLGFSSNPLCETPWRERLPYLGSCWVAYWGDDFRFVFTQWTKPIFSPHQKGFFLFLLSQLKC